MTATRFRRRELSTSVDAGMARLVQLVLDEDWSADTAARRLLAVVDDPEVLDRMAVIVRCSDRASSSAATARSVATVERALDEISPAQAAAVRSRSGRRPAGFPAKHLDVLVVENRRHAADESIAELHAAGHRVHRCFEPDGPGYPCAAIQEPGSCPLDHGVDVALAVRDNIEPRPTRYEQGVSCAIRASVPIAERGPVELDPFAPWVAYRSDDVVAGVEAAAEHGLDDLRQAISSRIALVVPPSIAPQAITCSFDRSGQRLVVQLSGPPIDRRLEQAIAVRVLDAVWRSGRTYGQVDVNYRSAEQEPGRSRP
jgi:hypothetical protein